MFDMNYEGLPSLISRTDVYCHRVPKPCWQISFYLKAWSTKQQHGVGTYLRC